MRSCEDEKMRYRPPLLEEPCAQTLSGKKIYMLSNVSDLRRKCVSTFACADVKRVSVSRSMSVYGISHICQTARAVVCWPVPGCPCARGSGLCPGARASDVLGACCLSATRTLYSPEVSRLQAVAVCLLIPQTVCPH